MRLRSLVMHFLFPKINCNNFLDDQISDAVVEGEKEDNYQGFFL